MVKAINKAQDVYGQFLLAQLESGEKLSEIIERDDDYIESGSRPGYYFSDYKDWDVPEKKIISFARGRVLDIGCGAGRHAIYLQDKGLDVTGVDNSPGAIKVSKSRGLKRALLRSIDDISKFKSNSFDTILMMGNNFGLFGNPAKAKRLLKIFAEITSDDARIIAGSRNPYVTTKRAHLRYLRFNKNRGRIAGQITIRARFGTTIGEWFDYLLVSPKEMEEILDGTKWKIEKLFGDTENNYFALIQRRAGTR
ncbi:MAG: class I SAM-dependent methyltransferase [Pyrinomonadaceae bacterium]